MIKITRDKIMIQSGSPVVSLLVMSVLALAAGCAISPREATGDQVSPVATRGNGAERGDATDHEREPQVTAAAIDPTGVDRTDYVALAETVLAEILAGPFSCDEGAWASKLYPQDPDLPSIFADGSEMFMAMANYVQATGHLELNGCNLITAMWNTFVSIDTLMSDNHYQTGISCAKLLWGLNALGGPAQTNPFWASLTQDERLQFQNWVLGNDDWAPVANNMYLFRAAIRYYIYAWGWGNTLSGATADQVTFLDHVTETGWLYDGSAGANDYSIYSVFGAMFNQRLNATRVQHGDVPVRPELSALYTAAMIRYFLFAAARAQEPMPWSRSNGLYGLGAWIGMPEIVLSEGGATGIERGMYKRAAHLYYLWAQNFWYDGEYLNPYVDPTGVAPYENAFNGNGQVVSSLLEAYVAAEESEGIAEVALPSEIIDYDLVFRFSDPDDPAYGVRIVNDPGEPDGLHIEKPAYSSDRTPPEVTITQPMTGSVVASPVDVAWAGAGAQFYLVYIDDALRSLTTTREISIDLAAGAHRIEVVASDGAWNLAADTTLIRVGVPTPIYRRYLPLAPD